jgi:hypothetical protein
MRFGYTACSNICILPYPGIIADNIGLFLRAVTPGTLDNRTADRTPEDGGNDTPSRDDIRAGTSRDNHHHTHRNGTTHPGRTATTLADDGYRC